MLLYDDFTPWDHEVEIILVCEDALIDQKVLGNERNENLSFL